MTPKEAADKTAHEWGRFEERVELGARALFEHERQTPLGRFAFPGSWAEVPPVERYRFMEQSRVVLKAAFPL